MNENKAWVVWAPKEGWAAYPTGGYRFACWTSRFVKALLFETQADAEGYGQRLGREFPLAEWRAVEIGEVRGAEKWVLRLPLPDPVYWTTEGTWGKCGARVWPTRAEALKELWGWAAGPIRDQVEVVEMSKL